VVPPVPLAVGIGIVLATLTAGSCTRADRAARDSSTVTILFESDDYVFGPRRDDTPKFLVFLSLTADRDGGDRLAERWEHSDDYRTWTIHLRRDVRWHDGVPVTAHDVAFTLALMRHPEILEHAPDAYTVTVLDDYTLEITYRRPREELDGWQVYYPKHLLEDLDPAAFYGWDFWHQPIGNGPYRVVRRVPGTLFELEANPDFYKGKPSIDRVVLRLGGTSKLAELTSGAVDIASYLRQTDIQKLADDPRFQIYHTFVYSEPVAIHWNHRHPFLAEPMVRRALTMAIDRKELFALLGFPEELPTFDGMGHWRRAAYQFRDGSLGKPLPHDPAAADRLLTEAGWADTDGDGVRERDGLTAELTMLAGEGGILETRELAVYFQDQLRRVGVRMDIEPLDSRAGWQRYREGRFDAFMRSFRFDAEDLLEADWFGDRSPIGYSNPDIVERLRRINATADSAEQDALYRELYPVFRRDVPVTFLFPWAETFAAHRRLRGMRPDDRRPGQRNPIRALEDLWIEEPR
jgi:peptide/nickel transport system substrate-binding protein